MTLLCPKQVDYHSYIVETDDLNSEAKKVTLSFSDLSKQNVTNMFNLPDKSLHVAYRVYYGKYEEGKDVSTIALNRNPSKPWIYDPWGGASDSNVIHNLEPDTKYVVYLQSYYETESLLNSQYTGGLPGPLFYKIIDTSRENGVSLTQPEFTLTLLNKKESAGQNTGLFNVPVKIENFANGVKYIPAYSIDNGQNWIYYEAQTEQNFTISVNNPLRMPTRSGEAWANNEWEYTPRTNSWGAWDDGNTYFIAIDRCRKLCGGYPTVKAQLKIIAEREDEVKESAIQEIVFDEYDDNIPPSMRNDIILHDSKLSFDGHSFTFNDLIYEDEGHLSEYFDFYYVPYQEMWGNNLNVLSEEEIKWLPSGVSSFNSNCWIDKGSGEAKYSLSMDIPVFGLADGKYMYFAKISDTFGNYKYVTLGQAHIGTFKNKLTVEYDSTNKRFISKLPIEADEENFNRYMINIQRLNYEDRKDTYSWNHQFDWSNELQDCRQTNQNGKTVLENISGVDGVFGTRDESDNYIEIEPKSLDAYTYYRITIQAFKTTDTYNYETRKGVDKAYGRPYTDISGALYDHDILGYVDNESEYDVCTDETVSNTVTMYIPPTYEQDPWWYYEPVQSSFFVDTATPRSNKDYFVQVIASSRDLGDDIDEWERRGKIVKTHMCNTGINVSGKFIANPDYDPEKPETTENPKYMKNPDCYPPNHFIDNENFDNTKDESEDNPKTIPDPDYYEVNQNFDNTKEESEKNPRYLLREQYKDNPDYNTFNASIALEDMYNSKEKGLVYYVVVAYFADNSRAMSKVYTMQGF